MSLVTLSAISYTNTKPFVWGLQHYEPIAGKIKLVFDTPAACAQKLIDKRADLGIVPVAALMAIPSMQILSRYCIGADGDVNSVFLLSKTPFGSIREVRLDSQSRASNTLARVLEQNYWRSGMLFSEPEAESHFLAHSPEAIILIGDRTFGEKEKWPYRYDLAGEWKKYTGLPFVFAVWASNRNLGDEFEALLNEALKLGLDNRAKVISGLSPVQGFDLEDYLQNRISYDLTPQKLEALSLYLELASKLEVTRHRLNKIITS